MARIFAIALLLAVLSLVAANADAVTVFTAELTNAQENPPVSPTTDAGDPRVSFGTAIFVLNDAQTALSFTSTITGIDFTGSQSADLNDDLVAAHIHAGPNAPPLNNGVVWGFFGTPFNDTVVPNVVVTPFASGVGGIVSGVWDAPEGNNTTLDAQLPNIFAGRAYINFHTNQFPSGEVRGQLVLVPEPSTVALLGTGLAGLLGRRWLRRRRSAMA